MSDPSGKELPPHPPPDMHSTYMTRYDYDYGRDPHSDTNNNNNHNDGGISGDVRNRPIFATQTGLHSDKEITIYQKDYVAPEGSPDMALLSRAAGHFLQDQADGALEQNPNIAGTFSRGPVSGMTTHVGGGHPDSVYRQDYTARAAPADTDGTLYAGARAAEYREDFLIPPANPNDDDGKDVAPKIGSKEAQVPFQQPLPSSPQPTTRSQAPLSLFGADREYGLTSYTYGDTSKAYPSQLPAPAQGSRNEHLLGTEREPAKMLAVLAGKTPATGGATTVLGDRTNPVYVRPSERNAVAVSRRLEEEHYVETTTYRTDYIDQGQLPELPGNHTEKDVRDTNVNPTATAGEMTAGVLTRETRQLASVRNTHGTLTANPSDGQQALLSMKVEERRTAVDRADPHRHKLH
ncbi:hypothetical protein AGDE_02130 [Angomonas deanei]|nr:hypothetical protein AGDE_05354 [Angomonas deanei]EPY41793.1 hypothetical protein AGDE_02130 [Angomonas deanei]|eukprot:EPY38575.1 hypothetical protein AGDE_05354 [Angomonas deanei]